MSNTAPTVGVVGLPQAAQALAEIGFIVHTEPTFRGAATTIARALPSGRFRVVVATLTEPGFIQWASSTAAKSDGLIVVRTNPAVDITRITGNVTVLDVPAKVNDLLPLLGYAPDTRPAGEVELAPAAAEVPAPLPTPPTPLTDEPAVAAEPAGTGFFDIVQDATPSPTPEDPAPATDVSDDVLSAALAVDEETPPDRTPEPPAAPAEAADSAAGHSFFDVQQPEQHSAPTPLPGPEEHSAPTPLTEPADTAGEAAPPAFFEDSPAQQPQVHVPASAPVSMSSGGAKVIVVGAAKGGVGKTTTSLMVAATAAAAGLRVVLVDANRGQGDIRTSLRLPAHAPGVYDAIHGKASDAVLLPDQVNALRPKGLDQVQFAVALAPLRHQSSPNLASADVYARVLDYARAHADLVVVDTQIIEGHKTDLFADFLLPAIRSGAWFLGIVSHDFSDASNLSDAYQEFFDVGFDPKTSLLIVTNWPDFDDTDRQQVLAHYGRWASFIGVVGRDPNIHDEKNSGNVLISSPAVKPVANLVLSHVTGKHIFEEAAAKAAKKAGKKRRGLFGKRR